MARTSLELNATVTGVQSIQQLSSALNESKERMKEFANLSEYDKLTQEAAVFRNLQNEATKMNQTMAQSAQGGSYTASAFNAYRNSGYGAPNPMYANAQTAVASKSLEQRIAEASKTIDKLTDELGDLIEQKDWRGSNNVSQTINQLETEKKRLEAEKSKSENEGVDKLRKWLSFDKFAQAANNIGNVAQAEFTYEADVANGNVVGAKRRRNTAIAGTVGNTLTTVGTGVAAFGGPIGLAVGGGLALMGIGTNFVSRYLEGKGTAEDAQANAYMGNFDAKYGAARAFGNMGKNREANAAFANDIYASAAAMARDTGLSTNDFLQIMTQAASYGVGGDVASRMARQAGLWTQATGADTNALMKLQGTAERYGLGSDAIGAAYGGLRASGMQKGQFNEFLQGLQTVIENGIQNGYASSVEEVSQNLSMFYHLSGDNALWQGQQGANRFNQMNSSLANATGLQSSTDMLVYGALNVGGSYVDTMEAIEKGLNDKEAFGKIFNAFSKVEGGNRNAVIERLRSAYGLNYTQAKQVYQMGLNLGSYSDADYKAEVAKFGNPTGAKTEQTEWQNALNDISLSMNAIGQGKWQDNLEEIKDLAKEYMGKAKGDTKHNVSVAKGSESEAVYTITDIMTEDFKALSRRTGGRGGFSSKMYSNLIDDKKGNNEYDAIFAQKLGEYAARYGDGKLSSQETITALVRADYDKDFAKAYAGNDVNAYMSALTKVLESVFSNMTIRDDS